VESDAAAARAAFVEKRKNGWKQPRKSGNIPGGGPASAPPDDPAARSTLAALQHSQAEMARAGSEASENLASEMARNKPEELAFAQSLSRASFEARVRGNGRTPRQSDRQRR
jgi:hypothetical protein